MKYITFFCVLICGFSSCSDKNKEYDPLKIVTDSQLDSILQDIIVYTDEHTPDSINATNRFEYKNKPFFTGLRTNYSFKYLSKGLDGSYSYFISKKARGTDDMFVGMAGKVILSPQYHIINLEESFRMWRMTKAELDKKGIQVYKDFVEGKSLEQYMNVEEKQYIEFPNDHVAYDKIKHEWKIVKLY
ncbi:MAG: hypothetical protein H7259_00255 [Cytophagales bacterium]|nr:hypothetical protein [Cytophaga sp.]